MWTIALIVNLLHLAYHQVMTNLDLFPFNNIRPFRRSERMTEASVNAVMMGFPIVALLTHNHQCVAAACVVLGFLLAGEFLTWWPCYFFGVPTRLKKWQEIYDRTHKQTISVLPSIRNHPVPNLEHCILQVLTAVTFAITLVYYRSI